MYIVIFASILALLFTYLENKGQFRNGMAWGFAIVTFLGAIHYDYGNDYLSYYEIYYQIVNTPFDLKEIIEGYVYHEPGWALLNYLFEYLGGFFVLVAVLNFIQNIIIYRFIKSEVPQKWQTLAVFMYLFVTSYYLMSFTMMRQWFVTCVFLSLWPLIKQKKWVVPLIILFLCSYIHTSARVLLPFAFIGYLPIRSSKPFTIIYALVIILLWISGTFVESLFQSMISITDFEGYSEKYGEAQAGGRYALGFYLQLIPLFVGIYYLYNSNESRENKIIVILSILNFAILAFSRMLPIVGRIGSYFVVFNLAAIPITYGFIKQKNVRNALLFFYILVVVYNYWYFFKNPTWVDHYTTFKTIFSVL